MRKSKYIKPEQIAHIWAHQTQEDGRTRVPTSMRDGSCPKSQMRFEGPAFYSYNTVIGRLGVYRKKRYAILDMYNFSPQTSVHQRLVWDALPPDVKQFNVMIGGWGQRLDLSPRALLEHYLEEGEKKSKETHKLGRIMFGIWGSARLRYCQAKVAAEFFGFGTKKIEKKIAWCIEQQAPYVEAAEKWDAGQAARQAARDEARRERQKRWDEQQAQYHRSHVLEFINDPKDNSPPYHGHVLPELMDQYVAACKVREDWLMERNKERMEEWMNGGRGYFTGLHDLPIRLRSRSDMHPEVNPVKIIETSHGAVIPYEDGLRCYRFCARLWRQEKEWHRNGEKFKVGPYYLDEVYMDGIKAGCHNIDRNEIERFAKQEGWVQSTEEKDEC